MPYKGTDAEKKAVREYQKRQDNIMIRPSKEEGAKVRKSAKNAGLSLQQYILEAVRTQIEQEKTVYWETWAGSLPKCPACGHEYCDMVECRNFCGNCGKRMTEN